MVKKNLTMTEKKVKTLYSYNTLIARWLRRNQTEAEKILWEKLRNRRLDGYKFKRQHGYTDFIVDFYCYSSKLIVELDGKIHLNVELKERDSICEEMLSSYGFRIIRFTNDEVLNDIDNVLNKIKNELK